MKVILAAGGSGGHIFPAVAVADELAKTGDTKILFVSSKRRLDKSILEKQEYTAFYLSVNPMPLRFRPIRMISFIVKIIADMVVSCFIMLRQRPDVVVGFGGYASGAITIAAKIFGVPIFIHEQNLFPGRANKILSKFAKRIAVSFSGTEKYFYRQRNKIVHTGNPLRAKLLSAERDGALKRLGLNSDKRTVLIMGGSQGSTFLNNTATKAAVRLNREIEDDVQFIHLTGRRDYVGIKNFYVENNISCRVESFMEKIEDAYAACDIAISRAGAAAIFELACYARPMILVPYPNPKNNQRSNAAYFAENNAAVYKEEKELTSEVLAEEICSILEDREKREKLAENAKRLSVPDAASKLSEEIKRLIAVKNG